MSMTVMGQSTTRRSSLAPALRDTHAFNLPAASQQAPGNELFQREARRAPYDLSQRLIASRRACVYCV